MSLATARNGDELLLFRPNALTLDECPDLPMIFACVVARFRGCVVFVFNPWRGEWELPSGRIETGESPEQAGIRELREESGQIVSALTYAGLALIRLRDGQLEPGVLFTCDLHHVDSFEVTDEAVALMLWNLQHPVGGHVNEMAFALADLLVASA